MLKAFTTKKVESETAKAVRIATTIAKEYHAKYSTARLCRISDLKRFDMNHDIFLRVVDHLRCYGFIVLGEYPNRLTIIQH